MLLTIEIGNSNTVFGFFEAGGDAPRAVYRVGTGRNRMPDEWFALLAALGAADGLRLEDVDGVILSSVVPSVTTWLVELVVARFGRQPIVVTADLDLGIDLLIDEPRQLGADRLVDCVAAFDRYGGPAIVIDLGTATTFDVISERGDYLGGLIAAGVATSLKALAANAAQLFNVELRMPVMSIGRNTTEQLQIGLVLGHQAMLEGMVRRTWDVLGVEAPTILTGGLSPLFAGQSPMFTHHDPDLTLDGLRLIWDRLASVASH